MDQSKKMKYKMAMLVLGLTMIHKLSANEDVLQCYQCENCSTVTEKDLKDCKPDNDICQIIYKHGNVSRHCLDDTGEFEYKCKDGQCFCEPYKTGTEIPCNNNTMFEELCATDTAFKTQFSAVCAPPAPPPTPTGGGGSTITIIIVIVVVLVVLLVVVGLVVMWKRKNNTHSLVSN